jgi:hypothetical protein
MLIVRATDDNYQLVIEYLRQGQRVADTTLNRQNALLEFILPTTTLGNAGPTFPTFPTRKRLRV